jgi:hypothetical protein
MWLSFVLVCLKAVELAGLCGTFCCVLCITISYYQNAIGLRSLTFIGPLACVMYRLRALALPGRLPSKQPLGWVVTTQCTVHNACETCPVDVVW